MGYFEETVSVLILPPHTCCMKAYHKNKCRFVGTLIRVLRLCKWGAQNTAT